MREINRIDCSCGGRAYFVTPTNDEEERYGCCRPNHCVNVIECEKCGIRLVLDLFPSECKE